MNEWESGVHGVRGGVFVCLFVCLYACMYVCMHIKSTNTKAEIVRERYLNLMPSVATLSKVPI